MTQHDDIELNNIDMNTNPLNQVRLPFRPDHSEFHEPVTQPTGFQGFIKKYIDKWTPEKGQGIKGMITNRLIVCGLAVALLWITNLQLATSIAMIAIPAPSSSLVYDQCEIAWEQVKIQHDEYEECSNRQLNWCNVTFTFAFDEELDRTTNASAFNKLLVQRAFSNRDACQKAYQDATETTKALQQVGITLIYVDVNTTNATCTAAELEEVKQMQGNVSDVRNYAYDLNRDYQRNSTGVISQLADAAEARRDYDIWYTQKKLGDLDGVSTDLGSMGNIYIGKIPTPFSLLDLQKLSSCISLADGCPTTGMKEIYEEVRDSLTAQYDVALATMDMNMDGFTRFTGSVDKLVSDVKTFNSYINSIADVLSTISGGFNFNLMPNPIVPTFHLTPLKAAVSVPSTASLYQQVQPFVAEFDANISSVKLQSVQIGTDWAKSVNLTVGDFPTFFDDYNPPDADINVTTLVDQHNGASDSYLMNSAVALNNFAALDQEERIYDPVESNATYYFQRARRFTPAFEWTYEPLSADVDVDWALVKVNSAFVLLVVFDYVYRAYKSYRTFVLYWGKSAVHIPAVDMTLDAQGQEVLNPHFTGTRGRIFFLLAHPWIPYFIIMLFFSLFVYAISAVYTPLFQEYIDGCVKSNNGTMLTENLYSIAYNYASEDGNTETNEGINEYNTQREHACGTYEERTQKEQADNSRDLTATLSAYGDTSHRVQVMHDCFNLTAMDGVMASDPIRWGAKPMLGTSTSTEACYQDPHPVLADGEFNCEAIPECNMTCPGPNKEVIRAYTYNCGCYVEYFVHSGFFKFSLSIFIYASLNLSRVLLISGICRRNWRNLSMGYFSYVGTCTRLGNTESLKGLEEKLELALHEYERQGNFLLLASALIHVPWIVVLSLVSLSVQYTQTLHV
eukprot:TRINITY_DN14706_c0_g1::TRINITY_DN14706_c0_g1_i1::g.21551::m.21551 TRINITY_DN14706_c0_g1::TRINITY_DN14706_c0_g1_i1::g.21551  ORF type:complete len:923 (+),score=242.06,YfhO/PF09586.5/0.00013,rve_3/PF13683.1/0.012 TRINITY_DN14706_c0_g1_i1:56-2770(+)